MWSDSWVGMTPISNVPPTQTFLSISPQPMQKWPKVEQTKSLVNTTQPFDQIDHPLFSILPAHVVDLDAEEEAGGDVEGDEEHPEIGVAVEDADHADKNDEGQGREGHVGVGVYVGMPDKKL